MSDVAAAVTGVLEVSLLGSARPDPWKALLDRDHLEPLLGRGRVRIMVVAASARYMGVRFREISFSILVAPSAALLVQAFSSVRFFAWIERRCFGTPYAHARLRVDRGAMDLEGRFRAATPGPEADPVTESWEGTIHLPGGARAFRARLSGPTVRAPFLPERDALSLRRSPEFPVFDQLLDSDFRPETWILRNGATHVKGKTRPRSDFAPPAGDSRV
jgi:hypothetical protein